MQDFVAMILAEIREETVGLIGGALFFGSWILQAAESRKLGRPVVSVRFFSIRAAASLLLAVEGLRSGSLSVFAVMAATGLLMLYNIVLALRGKSSGSAGEESG